MKDKNHTKQKIIDAMYHLIGKEGYEKASMGKICDSIDITKAAAYYYFKSKEDIFLEIVKNLYEEDYSKYIENINKSNNKEEYRTALLQFGLSFFDMYQNDLELQKICYEIDIQAYRIPRVKEYIDAVNHKMNKILNKILEKGVSLGLFEEDTIHIKAQYLQIVMEGLDKAILFKFPICATEVWQYSVDQLFLKEKN